MEAPSLPREDPMEVLKAAATYRAEAFEEARQRVLRWSDREARTKAIQEAVLLVSKRLEQAQVRPSGGRLEVWALCPFHQDSRVGSFSVDGRTGKYYCWVCGAAGGLVRLLQHYGLWDRTMRGAILPALEGLWGAAPSVEEEPALRLPESLLKGCQRQIPRRYLCRGHRAELLRECGVCYDAQHDRILWPVRSLEGDLLGIQSRAATEDRWSRELRWRWYDRELVELQPDALPADFLDTYQPPRSKFFWLEHLGMRALVAGQSSTLVLVEGMGAALRVMACGYACVASFGTRLGKAQVRRLIRALDHSTNQSRGKRPTLILAQDGDDAGHDARLEAYFRLMGHAELRWVDLPQGADPEDLSVKDLKPRLDGAQTLTEMAPLSLARDRALQSLQRLSQRRHTMARTHTSLWRTSGHASTADAAR